MEDLELVFLSLEDIAELTVSLISQVEDITEMTDSNQTPLIGVCFLETAEVNFHISVCIMIIF